MSDDNFRKVLSDALTTYYETSIPYIEEHDFSPEFDEKMEKLINRRKKPYFKMINTMSKKVACVAGVFLIASSVTIMSVDALRNRMADLFVKQSKDHSIIRYEGNDISPSSIEDIFMKLHTTLADLILCIRIIIISADIQLISKIIQLYISINMLKNFTM